MSCKYLTIYSGGRSCGLARHSSPTEQQCKACQESGRNEIVGLGDTVARYINKTPLRLLKSKGCGCKRRQDLLNKLMPKKESQ
jgi:hypothetical protein